MSPVATPEQPISDSTTSINQNETQLVAPHGGALSDTPVMEIDYFSDAEDGLDSFSGKDKYMPYILVLQAMSPQVKKGDRRIDGAEEGDIFSTHTNRPYSGETGIVVIPCAYQRYFLEFSVNPQSREIEGVVDVHPLESNMMARAKKELVGEKTRFFLPNGSEIVDAAYHYVLVIDDQTPFGFYPAVIKFSRTKLKPCREWNTLISKRTMTINNPNTGKQTTIKPPLYAVKWRLCTYTETDGKNSFSNWKINEDSFEGFVDDPIVYNAAKSFRNEVLEGIAKVDHTVEDAGGGEMGNDSESEGYEENSNSSMGNAHHTSGTGTGKNSNRTPF